MSALYSAHFGLHEAPFSIAPSPRFVCMSDRFREALAHLLYGLNEGGGFVQLTGEVGTGKTTICRTLLGQLPRSVDVALIFNPKLSVHELLQTVCEELQVPMLEPQPSHKQLVDRLHWHLLKANAEGRQTVLIIDEAQNLAPDVLEQVRLLTNLETERNKLLQIFLVGQPELRGLLARPDLRQVAQRITARYHLGALKPDETRAYINHRLSVAGAVNLDEQPIFTPGAMRAVHKGAGGIPRLVNIICDRSLLGAYASSRRQVDAATVRRAVREVGGGTGGTLFGKALGRSALASTSAAPHWLGPAMAGAAAAGVIAMGVALWSGRLSPPETATVATAAQRPVAATVPRGSAVVAAPAVGAPDPGGAGTVASQAGSGAAGTASGAGLDSGSATAGSLAARLGAGRTPEHGTRGSASDAAPTAPGVAGPTATSGAIVSSGDDAAAIGGTDARAVTEGSGSGARFTASTRSGPVITGSKARPGAHPDNASPAAVERLGAIARPQGVSPPQRSAPAAGTAEARGAGQPGDELVALAQPGASAPTESPGATRSINTQGATNVGRSTSRRTKPAFALDLATAKAALAMAWRLDPGTGETLCSAAARAALRCVAGAGDSRRLSRLNRPAMLALRDPDGAVTYAALLGLRGGLADVLVDGERRRVPFSDIEPRWNGRFRVLIPEAIPAGSTLRPGRSRDDVPTLRATLARLRGETSPAGSLTLYDPALVQAVRQFQAGEGIPVDGVVGPGTRRRIAQAVAATGPSLLLR